MVGIAAAAGFSRRHSSRLPLRSISAYPGSQPGWESALDNPRADCTTQRCGRVGPLIVAHALIDAVAFIGYAYLAGHVAWLPVPPHGH